MKILLVIYAVLVVSACSPEARQMYHELRMQEITHKQNSCERLKGRPDFVELIETSAGQDYFRQICQIKETKATF